MHQHHHHNHKDQIGNRLIITVFLNFGITAVQIVGGIFSNSLSLISDAFHNLGDGLAVLIAYIANRIGKKKSDHKKTFGYKRAEILAAFINASILMVIIIFLFREAYFRFLNPSEVNSKLMLWVAVFGLIANLAAVLLLKSHSHGNLNVRAAYIHLIGDTLSSVAVIVGGVLMLYFEWYWVDPLITVIIGIYILRETWAIVRSTIDILMQSTPDSIDIVKIQNQLEAVEGVDNIHHVHVWNLSDQQIHFECHVDVKSDMLISQCNKIRDEMEHLLRHNYDIQHITIQMELDQCDEKNLIHQHTH